jgi:hypothetical protein
LAALFFLKQSHIEKLRLTDIPAGLGFESYLKAR